MALFSENVNTTSEFHWSSSLEKIETQNKLKHTYRIHWSRNNKKVRCSYFSNIPRKGEEEGKMQIEKSSILHNSEQKK